MEHGDDPEAGQAWLEAQRDPDEARLVGALLGAGEVAQARRAYAAWLRARGDRRAEVLDLALALETTPDPVAARRLGELLVDVAPGWWRMVRAPRFQLLCGDARGQPPAVRFRVRCPMSWEELAATAEPAVRHCGRCHEPVYRCEDLPTAEAHARAGRCISVPARLVEGFADLEVHLTGRPAHPVVRWARALFGDPE